MRTRLPVRLPLLLVCVGQPHDMLSGPNAAPRCLASLPPLLPPAAPPCHASQLTLTLPALQVIIMLLHHLAVRMVLPGAKAAAGAMPLVRPMAVRGAASAAGAWSPAAAKQPAAARGQQQQVQSYTYEPVGMDASAEIGEVDFDPAAANSGALPACTCWTCTATLAQGQQVLLHCAGWL